MTVSIDIVIVTHNSKEDLQVCLDHIAAQSQPVRHVVVVDSGSTDTGYLETLSFNGQLTKILETNIGYGRANNVGYGTLRNNQGDLVVFMNPDTFLTADFCSKLIDCAGKHHEAAVFAGKLMGYDRNSRAVTGKMDSTGIFRKWYGRWYDRGQGEKDLGQYNSVQEIAAACGALLCCRCSALRQFGEQIFDPAFFMYKEDIEFSVRIRSVGGKIIYDPKLLAYHCRGWESARSKMSYELRLAAAQNEVLLYQKHPSPYIIWALFKLCLVRCLKI